MRTAAPAAVVAAAVALVAATAAVAGAATAVVVAATAAVVAAAVVEITNPRLHESQAKQARPTVEPVCVSEPERPVFTPKAAGGARVRDPRLSYPTPSG